MPDRGSGYGIPPPNTGNAALDIAHRVLIKLLHAERRVDPLYRAAFDSAFREALTKVAMWLKNRQRQDEGFRLAEERIAPDEEASLQAIIDTFTAQMRGLWKPGYFERGGNTKTFGIVRAEFIVLDDLPEAIRRGIFAEPRTYRAWVRYSGPGPYITPDIDDVGFMSMSIKLMGVPGPKLMDDEQHTQDLLGTSVPTFVCPNTRTNARLQTWSLKNAPLFYFVDPRESHAVDGVMNLLWTKTQSSPLECQYFSCVPYLLGDGQAMQYSFWSRLTTR